MITQNLKKIIQVKEASHKKTYDSIYKKCNRQIYTDGPISGW